MAIFDSKIGAGKCQANGGQMCLLLKERSVHLDEAIAELCSDKAAYAKEAAKGEFGCCVGLASRQQKDGVNSCRQHAEEERKDRRPEAEEGSDHGKELDVAQAHAFAVA